MKLDCAEGGRFRCGILSNGDRRGTIYDETEKM